MIGHGKDVFTYLFNAKYRIDERDGKDASPADPINEMHRYRDAILYRSQEGGHKLPRQIVGVYVLYLGRPLPQSYDYAELIENENIGAMPLLPGVDGGVALKGFIGTILAKGSAQAHLEKDIPTRGTAVVVANEPMEYLEKSVVHGTYHSGQLEWIKSHHLYNMPVGMAQQLGIATKVDADARSLLYLVPGSQGHRATPSVLRIKSCSARKVARKELEEAHGYVPKKPAEANKEYWLWELEA